ncbi:hypothetical protein E2C01_024567 [Portunus trituberculatus]|uniref:Uncharacterized protein n=1 Tax=Portunus trituberculatus TaxID=210409 RepID=A0A5B7EAX6_PORTR|nr:hypothetical protein [Portunus trituberculatus]
MSWPAANSLTSIVLKYIIKNNGRDAVMSEDRWGTSIFRRLMLFVRHHPVKQEEEEDEEEEGGYSHGRCTE